MHIDDSVTRAVAVNYFYERSMFRHIRWQRDMLRNELHSVQQKQFLDSLFRFER